MKKDLANSAETRGGIDMGVSENSGYLIWGPYNKDLTI